MAGSFFRQMLVALFRNNVACCRAFRALFDIVADLLSFSQSFEATTLDSAEVYEKVVATIIRRDEAEAFAFVEPFYCACSHNFLPFNLTKKPYFRRC